MASLVCDICEGKLVGKPGGIFECEVCGMEYSLEWAKAKMQELKGADPAPAAEKIHTEIPQVREEVSEADMAERLAAAAVLPELREKQKNSKKLIACGDCLLCLKEDGTVYCTNKRIEKENWQNVASVICSGPNVMGLTNDGDLIIDQNSIYAFKIRNWHDIVEVDSGVKHLAALRADGTVLAAASDFGPCEDKFAQCAVTGWNGIVAIACGSAHTVGLKSDGTVLAVGENGFGQCDVAGWHDISAVACDGDITVGLRSDGTVVASGKGFGKGEAGDVSPWRDVVDIACGYQFVAGLRKDGTVAVSGRGCDEFDVGSWRNIVSVACSDSYIVGLRADGTTVITGENSFDRCDVGEWTDIAAITCGTIKTVGLRTDGTIVATDDSDFAEWRLFGSNEIQEEETEE